MSERRNDLGQPIPPGASSRTIRVGALTRASRASAPTSNCANGVAERVESTSTNPPRVLRGSEAAAHTEPPDLTARICGICPVAYQTSAMNSSRDACGVTPISAAGRVAPVAVLREGFTATRCNIYMLHALDFSASSTSASRNHRLPPWSV